MANSLFQTLGGGAQMNNPIMQFPKFMQQMRGKDPNAIINGLISSGQINQQQLNQVQQQAQQMSAMFDQFKSMFHF